jgi:hypothetical protein
MTFSPWDTSSLPADVTSSEGGYRLTRAGGSSGMRIVGQPHRKDSGKYAIRLLVSRATFSGAPAIGVRTGSSVSYLGAAVTDWAFWGDESGTDEFTYHGGAATAHGDLGDFATEREVMIEIDIDAGMIWWGVDGVWAEGDPAAGTGATYENIDGLVELVADMYYEGTVELLQPADFTTPSTDGFTAGWPDNPPVDAHLSVPGPLASPELFGELALFAEIQIPSPLRPPRAYGINDWTGTVPRTAQIYYRAELRKNGQILPLRISSWQATIQADRSSYLQAVVPAATDYIDQIVDMGLDSELVIVRGALLTDGITRELDMASVPLGQLPYQRGHTRATVTLSGYGRVVFENIDEEAPPAGGVRALDDVQTISTQGGTRVRASVDWLLRPGMVASADGLQFNVSYINYYVNRNGEFMDVGERPL